jgi:hypothetical protein
MTAPMVEEQAAEQFAVRMLGVINHAALALMASVGHRTGLFQAMTGLAPGTSTEIAQAAGLQERYVREWLGAMATGGVVRHDAATGRYVLPPEHAAFLTPAAGPDNLAAFARELAYFAKAEDAVVDRFRSGGGLGYDAYGGYLAVVGELTGAVYDASVVQWTLPLVPGLVERLERGIDWPTAGRAWAPPGASNWPGASSPRPASATSRCARYPATSSAATSSHPSADQAPHLGGARRLPLPERPEPLAARSWPSCCAGRRRPGTDPRSRQGNDDPGDHRSRSSPPTSRAGDARRGAP